MRVGIARCNHYFRRAMAIITGTLRGATFTFSWHIPNTPVRGSGVLTLSNGDRQLAGSYQDFSTRAGGPFVLTRQ